MKLNCTATLISVIKLTLVGMAFILTEKATHYVSGISGGICVIALYTFSNFLLLYFFKERNSRHTEPEMIKRIDPAEVLETLLAVQDKHELQHLSIRMETIRNAARAKGLFTDVLRMESAMNLLFRIVETRKQKNDVDLFH